MTIEHTICVEGSGESDNSNNVVEQPTQALSIAVGPMDDTVGLGLFFFFFEKDLLLRYMENFDVLDHKYIIALPYLHAIQMFRPLFCFYFLNPLITIIGYNNGISLVLGYY